MVIILYVTRITLYLIYTLHTCLVFILLVKIYRLKLRLYMSVDVVWMEVTLQLLIKKLQVHVRENQRGNEEWIIQRHLKH
jgi:hypothetical protein